MTVLKLNLYSTAHCHLCEQAECLLKDLPLHPKQLEWLVVEITENEALLEKYETTIPVLKRTDNNTELKWPFNITDIMLFISQ